jgi:hypothetical protein
MVFMGVIFAFLDPNPQRYSKLGDFFVCMCFIQLGFTCCPSDSTVSEEDAAGTEPRTGLRPSALAASDAK